MAHLGVAHLGVAHYGDRIAVNFEGMETKDSNGNILKEGDSVLLIKDLKVKGFQKDLKRGTLVKNIRLTDNPQEVEGKVEGSVLVLKSMFLKKK